MSSDSGSGASTDAQKSTERYTLGTVERSAIAGAMFGASAGFVPGMFREFMKINWNDFQLWKANKLVLGAGKGVIAGAFAGATYALTLEGMERITNEQRCRNHFVAGFVTTLPFTLMYRNPMKSVKFGTYFGAFCYGLAVFATQAQVKNHFEKPSPASRCRYPEMYLYVEAFNRTADEDIEELKKVANKVMNSV